MGAAVLPLPPEDGRQDPVQLVLPGGLSGGEFRGANHRPSVFQSWSSGSEKQPGPYLNRKTPLDLQLNHHHHHHTAIPKNRRPQAFHPLCARMAGLPMELRESKDPSKPLQLVTFCYKHCTPKPEKAGA
jgi:hypothetical protein